MEFAESNGLMSGWLALTHIQTNTAGRLEQALQERHQMSLKEFYLLLFLSEAPGKKLRLQQLESMVGLSQSAMSRLVSRFEAKGCGALKRHICEEDRRSVYTSLTPIGQEKVDRAYSTVQSVLLDALPGRELESLLNQLLEAKGSSADS
ncbi:DNA-binding transcriptional regulator, MarR family [Paenibacillus sophorae]|uniref:DNA-binding transcriptional regulator, MarR family n=1 Tax=Paenibacillus sophorae TaxID=1333845 RepID=A0A1H8SED4_9BACL|nr:MarR family winged helix-turn-helix transcriptional regulator [Paenibacillus sophorae]QWU16747.1 MarR family winged helix-turn-helix transcriptional regulator [Paenibacillus sophorae]SEO77031.1 DNA-binding transcriptional regulator, MarR family [Paenibacillus sophorae]